MKKNIFPVFFVLAAIVLSIVVTRWMVEGKAREQGMFKADLLSIQMKLLKNSSVLRPIQDAQSRSDLQKYLVEANHLFGWYFGLVKEFSTKYPGRVDPEAIIKEKKTLAKEDGPRQKTAQSNMPIYEECYKLVRGFYDQMTQGKYTAVASDFSGSVRLDVHAIKKEGDKLKWEIMVMGGIGPVVYGGWTMKCYKPPTEAEKAAYEKEAAKAKRAGREPEVQDPTALHSAESTSSTNHPVLPDFEGSDYIQDFPPGLGINYWYSPPCPADTETMQMEFRMRSRPLSGEDQVMAFVFKLPVDGSLKGNWDGVQKMDAASDYK